MTELMVEPERMLQSRGRQQGQVQVHSRHKLKLWESLPSRCCTVLESGKVLLTYLHSPAQAAALVGRVVQEVRGVEEVSHKLVPDGAHLRREASGVRGIGGALTREGPAESVVGTGRPDRAP